MKNKNILLLLENSVDKIILAASILASLFLLWIFVIGSPYSEEIKIQSGRERKLGPSEIDRVIKEAAEVAASELDKPASPLPTRKKDYVAEYSKLLQSSIPEISTSVKMPYPGVSDAGVQEDRTYTLPEIPSLSAVAASHLRGAAKIPRGEVGTEQSYDSTSFVASEIDDVDLVTVSAQFDVQSLYNNFEQSFMGPRLKTFEKDARLAAPIFARLELQRRTKDDNGDWGPWGVVRRTSIDVNRKLLEELPMMLDDSSFGVDIWISQYQNQDVQFDILQPEAYSFAVSPIEWMPPEYIKEALDVMEKQDQQAKRKRLEELRKRRTDRSTDTGDRSTRRTRPKSRGRGTGTENSIRRPNPRTIRKERTVEDVRKDFEKELLDDKSNLRALPNNLLVWAHDDTVEPGKTYQYRIRMGVFNPIAGKDWFRDDQLDYKNQLVLWSSYSQITDEVGIPKRIYVFPIDVIANRDTPNNFEGVQVEVAKYYLGQWRTYNFDVHPGEMIGYEVEDMDEMDGTVSETGFDQFDKNAERVDFTSGFILIDVYQEVVWGNRLRRTTLNNMIYYDTDEKIQQATIGKTNWNSEKRDIYDKIQESIEKGSEQRNFQMDNTTPVIPVIPVIP